MLYKIDSMTKNIVSFPKLTDLNSIGWLEKDLENLIARNIDTLMGKDLLVVFQERQWQEEPDILALDQDGNVWIFELKRWSATTDSVHQLLRYAEKFGKASYEFLNHYYCQYKTGRPNGDSLKVEPLVIAHQKHFNLEVPLPIGKFNSSQTLVLVSDGNDVECESSVSFWLKKGLDFRFVPFHVYQISPDESVIEFPNGQSFGNGAWLLNTNQNSGTQYETEMIAEEKAAAYYNPWKYKIENMRKGDRVFLYSNTNGIIATGVVDGKVNKKAFDGVPDDEYFVPLAQFKKLTKPLTAADIKLLGIQLIYRQTLVGMDSAVADLLLKHC